MRLVEITPARHGVIRKEYAEDPEQDLRERVEGEVRFSDADRALYATDASRYRHVPIGVVIPKSVDDVIAAVAVCRQYGGPVFSRGGGTSLAGQCCNTGVVFDFSKYLNRLVELDPFERFARVEPGIVLSALNSEAAKWGLTFAPDPVSQDRCTIGGAIGNNAYGVHHFVTADFVEELDVLTYDGVRKTAGATAGGDFDRILGEGSRRAEIYRKLRGIAGRYGELVRQRCPKIPLRGSGYALDQLLPENGFHVARALAGSESTCVTVLGAKVRLVFEPQVRTLLAVEYPDVYAAAADVPMVLASSPAAMEGFEMPAGRARLLVEFAGADRGECDDRARR